jgi:hypothetical protein
MSAREKELKLEEWARGDSSPAGFRAWRKGGGSGLYIAARLSLVTAFLAGLEALVLRALVGAGAGSLSSRRELMEEVAACTPGGGLALVGVSGLLLSAWADTLLMGLGASALASVRAMVDAEHDAEALAGRL